MSDDPDDLNSICDHCGEAVNEIDADDCQPDDDGFCIRCGKQIGASA